MAHFGREWSSGLQAGRMVLPTSAEAWDWREQILGCHVLASAGLHEEERLPGKGDPPDFGFHGLENKVPTDQASGQEKGWG